MNSTTGHIYCHRLYYVSNTPYRQHTTVTNLVPLWEEVMEQAVNWRSNAMFQFRKWIPLSLCLLFSRLFQDPLWLQKHTRSSLLWPKWLFFTKTKALRMLNTSHTHTCLAGVWQPSGYNDSFCVPSPVSEHRNSDTNPLKAVYFFGLRFHLIFSFFDESLLE